MARFATFWCAAGLLASLAAVGWLALCRAEGPSTAEANPHVIIEVLRPPAAPAEGKEESAEEKIRRALEVRVRVELVDAPLGEVCRALARRLRINVILDHEALDQFDLSEHASVTFEYPGLPVKTMLDGALVDLDLTYTVRDEVLWITTKEEVECDLDTIVYDVADLVALRRGDGSYDCNYEPLVRLITKTIEPDSWTEMGGNGTVEPFVADHLRVLIIKQTEHAQKKVQELLADLRGYRSEEKIVRPGPPGGRGDHSRAAKEPKSRAEAIHDALDKKIDLRLEKVPLGEFANRLERLLGISVLIDRESLESLDLSADTPVSAELSDITARSALAIALRPLELGWVITDDALVICSLDSADEKLVVRVYNVADLIESIGNDPPLPDFEPLISILTNTVAPDTWVEMGGNGEVEPAERGGSRVLVIMQTWPVHEEVEELLDQLRRARGASRGVEKTALAGASG